MTFIIFTIFDNIHYLHIRQHSSPSSTAYSVSWHYDHHTFCATASSFQHHRRRAPDLSRYTYILRLSLL
ncbi:hypothetical protein BDQ12DRAFT_693217 [Crucibulum laeve]|uniref:Uncharacterized protein n=1 Tax=Crucibulum laeve TaxID=68775 RepID=A0A5C3LGT1_9AGAR|nr:hypothetical protein BDQ12DRAFT_693217 [Crucibulum laeve]